LKNHLLKSCILFCSFFYFQEAKAQLPDLGQVHGNFQLDAQYYNPDEKIGAADVPEKLLMNGFANLNYNINKFTAGLRYESYLNPLQGFDPRYKGNGIPYRFITWKADELEVTVGNYYEQFGSGMILRSYEEKNLGLDNVFDGVRLKYNPVNGIYLKGLVGKQRSFFSVGPGLVRGFDGEINFNETFKSLSEKRTRVNLGGSFVSKFQADDDPDLVLPQNVGATAARIKVESGEFGFNAEYVYKINDPSNDNNFIYKPGEALLATTTYTKKGLGISLSAKRIDNMGFRSDRNATLTDVMINYLPALTKPHTYSLLAFYPYATQPNGEIGFQGEISYKFKKETPLGGAFGTEIALSYSGANALDTNQLNDLDGRRKGYSSEFFSMGEEIYYRDLVFELSKKFSKSFKVNLSYAYQVYNKEVIQGLGGYPMIYANIGVADITYKYRPDKAFRTELQHLQTKQDHGNWVMMLEEYTIGSNWFVAAQDQYNYGNEEEDQRLHYFNFSAGYTKNANRISMSYGRQRAGVFCVGGICRAVPASNGLLLSVTSSF
jgi:hypothetical protein